MSTECHFCNKKAEKVQLSACCGYCVNACTSCVEESEQIKYMFDYNLHHKYKTFDKCDNLSEGDKDPTSERWDWTK